MSVESSKKYSHLLVLSKEIIISKGTTCHKKNKLIQEKFGNFKHLLICGLLCSPRPNNIMCYWDEASIHICKYNRCWNNLAANNIHLCNGWNEKNRKARVNCDKLFCLIRDFLMKTTCKALQQLDLIGAISFSSKWGSELNY